MGISNARHETGMNQETNNMKPSNPLEKDLEAFNKELPTLQSQAGKFALFVHGKLEGVYDTNQEAFEKGYVKAGPNPFLVRQITTIPSVQHFTRAIGFKCLTSPLVTANQGH
jgi:hypothetical protein